MEQILLNNLKSQEVFPILIKWKNTLYYTGFYYDESGQDSLFHSYKNIECFNTISGLTEFCMSRSLNLTGEIVKYDFDISPSNPIDYKDILDKWNLLNTISENLKVFFAGNEKKYNKLYNFLFSCNFAVNPLPLPYQISDNYFCLILKVFSKQSKLLNKALSINKKTV